MKRTLVSLALLVYLVALWQLALTPAGSADTPALRGNLVPLASLRDQLDSVAPPGHRAYYIVGNLLMFTPPVVLAWVGWPRVRLRMVLLGVVVTSASVEGAQHAAVAGRAGDIDDVILNTLGAATVALLLAALRTRPARPRTSPVPAAG